SIPVIRSTGKDGYHPSYFFRRHFDMTISQELTKNGVKMTLMGAMDSNSAPGFSIAILSAIDEYDHVTLDFSGLTYISSAGLRALLSAQKKANVTQKEIQVINVPANVREIFSMTGFMSILHVEE
ncbi:MAG TPA: hypothetical protein DCY74_08215, partial [Clostridiales bacterium]|nr:hypothetical protein [Clostridiales bacterium]